MGTLEIILFYVKKNKVCHLFTNVLYTEYSITDLTSKMKLNMKLTVNVTHNYKVNFQNVLLLQSNIHWVIYSQIYFMFNFLSPI